MTACGSFAGDLIATSGTASALLLRHNGLNWVIPVATLPSCKSSCFTRQASRPRCLRIPASPVDSCGLLLDENQCGRDDQPSRSSCHFFDHLMFSGSVSQLQRRALHTAACKTAAEENLMQSRIIWTIVASDVVLIGIGLMHFSLTALQEPSPLEPRITNLAKHSVIRLPAATEFPRRQLTKEAASKQQGTHFGLDCGICRGVDGRAQTPAGQWMYPRTADLTSNRMQSYSDSGAVLDHQQRHPIHGDAGLWQD